MKNQSKVAVWGMEADGKCTSTSTNPIMPPTVKKKEIMKIQQELTKAELEIMQILWRREKAFVNEVLDDMPEPKPAYNTVSTIIRILEKKGVVGHKAFGKSHRYHPLIGKEEYTQHFMSNVMNNFFDNSFTQMFSFFTAKESLSAQEIEEVMGIARQVIEQKKAK